MSALHKIELNPSKIEAIEQEKSPLQVFDEQCEKLRNYLTSLLSRENNIPRFEEQEEKISQFTFDVGRTALALSLSAYDKLSDVILVEAESYRKTVKGKKRYQTSLGEVEVERHLYANRKKGGEGKSICPLELQCGIIEGYWTLTAAKNAMYALAHVTPEETENILLRTGGMSPSRSSLDRLPKRLNDFIEPCIVIEQKALNASAPIPAAAVTVATSLDGVMIAMKPKKGEKKTKKQSCEWREASCGTISFFDAAGERLDTWHYGRLPEHKKATLKTLLKNSIDDIKKKRPDLKQIQIADGAQDNWTFFDEEMPWHFQVTDFYHACEHLKEGLHAVYLEDEAKEQYDKYKAILRDDEQGINKVLRKLRYLRDKNKVNETLRKALTYFVNNQHRMEYAKAKHLNYPIGSGVVEAACKSIVGQRLKRSGMSWCLQGEQAILTFRAWVKSHQFDRAWEFVQRHYVKDVVSVTNVIPFPVHKVG